jgi:DNA polymerase-3 subunit gamma/tau
LGQALYRKYRSKSLSEIVGQEHITQTLERAIKAGKISHAYLFTGPRGVGKTSIARILAHEINGLEYTDESIHLDIIEIDAASNRRIDEIRDLRDKVHIAPTSAKYKVYIIDEVHMLTKEAFNALLKTLEEPPAHVIFILATTELHKLPETIVSRTQRFTFKPIAEQDAVMHLRSIADSESIKIDDEALQLLATHGNGSFRDSISLLDQVGSSSAKVISKADVEDMLGLAAKEHIAGLYSAVTQGTPARIVEAIDKIIEDGIGPTQVAKQLATHTRQEVLQGSTQTAELTSLLEQLLKVSGSPDPAIQLELSLFSANSALNPSARPVAASVTAPVVAKMQAPLPAVAPPKIAPTPPVAPVVKEESQASSETEVAEPVQVTEPTMPNASPAEWWPEVLKAIKSVNNTLYGVLRMAAANLDGDTLTLAFKFGFHQKKIADGPTQAKLHDAIAAITGKNITIVAVHDKAAEPTTITSTAVETSSIAEELEKPAVNNEDLTSITNVFGGGEVLES